MIKYRNRMLGLFSSAALLLTAACASDNVDLEKPVPEPQAPELNQITLSVYPEELSFGSRAETVNPFGTISNGSKVDVLIFAVYEKNEDGNFVLAKEFQKETDNITVNNVAAANGQNVIPVTKDFWPFEIQLSTNPQKSYKVAFWAQSSESEAFNTEQLDNVKVIYDNAYNNDELRDAFCAASKQFPGNTTEKVEVILRRPFAQINVGTTGADYKNLMTGAKIFPNKILQESRITIKGVANVIDVVNDAIDIEGTLDEVTFAWNKIPAYVNIKQLPVKDESAEDPYKNLLRMDDEEMLYVKLNAPTNSGQFKDYKTEYPTVTKSEDGKTITSYETEVFKYLSMCYVLVKEKNENDNTGGTVDVTFSFREKGAENGMTPLSIKNVPVKRNWRTNIIGGLYAPDDVDEPEDPTSIFNTRLICVHLDPIYEGENNGIIDNGENGEIEWKETIFPDSSDINSKYDHKDNE